MDTLEKHTVGRYCSECGQDFPPSEMVSVSNYWVCAACKPVFLQRLVEGAPVGRGAGLFRAKRDLLVRQNSPLPDNCIRCNAAANGFKLKRRLYWHPSWYYLLILVGILIYAIVALIGRKRAVVEIGLCEKHRKNRNMTIGVCWLAALFGIAAVIFGGNSGALIAFGILLVPTAAIFGLLMTRMVYATRIDTDFVSVRGAGQDFLMNFPEWKGPI